MAGFEMYQPQRVTAGGTPVNGGGSSSGLLGAAASTQGKDYDRMMGEYDSLLSGYKAAGQQPIQRPSLLTMPTNLTDAVSKYKTMSETGGYDDASLGAIRARGVAPIRSVYANAERELNRTKRLQGGYSPSYNATAAKMAREQSSLLSDMSTKVEADIADRLASGKMSALAGYGGLSGQMAQMQAQIDAQNQASQERYNSTVLESPYKSLQGQMSAVEGMRGLYGTTPALMSTANNINNSQVDIAKDSMFNPYPQQNNLSGGYTPRFTAAGGMY